MEALGSLDGVNMAHDVNKRWTQALAQNWWFLGVTDGSHHQMTK